MFTKENIRIANKLMTTCSTSIVIIKMQIKTTIRCCSPCYMVKDLKPDHN